MKSRKGTAEAKSLFGLQSRRMGFSYVRGHMIMSNVKPIPDGVPVVMPILVCRDASAEIDFCKITFGAVESVLRPGPDGTVAHALMKIAAEREERWSGIVKG